MHFCCLDGKVSRLPPKRVLHVQYDSSQMAYPTTNYACAEPYYELSAGIQTISTPLPCGEQQVWGTHNGFRHFQIADMISITSPLSYPLLAPVFIYTSIIYSAHNRTAWRFKRLAACEEGAQSP